MSIPQFPTLVTRALKGEALLDAELDANWANLKSYCLTLANLLSTALNADGTLVADAVSTESLQAAAVTLAALNPSLLYSIVPVDTDSGTVNKYAITAKGGLGGTNLIPSGAAYDANGNYVLTGLTKNYGYYWAKGTNDASVVVNTSLTLSGDSSDSSGGAFTATQTMVTLTGTPSASVTASLSLSAPVSAYKDGQMFFVYTATANTGASTLNVNNLGNIPILRNGKALVENEIGASSVFAAVYKAGSFVLLSGSGSDSSSSSSDSTISYTVSGVVLYSSGQIALPAAGGSTTLAHGLGQIPTVVTASLIKVDADATTAAVGQYVSLDQFLANGSPAFAAVFDDTNVTVQLGASTPTFNGTAITTGSWRLVIGAQKLGNVSTNVFPALTYTLAEPEGAVSYGDKLLVFNYANHAAVVRGSVINLTSNVATPLTAPNSGKPRYQNHGLFTRADGSVDSVFTSNAGLYRVPAVDPSTNIVPVAQVYDSTGLYSLTISAGVAYTITKGSNDLQYSFDGATYTDLTSSQVAIPSSNTYTTLYLKGNPNGSVTASVATIGTWQPVQINSTKTGFYEYKPAWITESSGSITVVYACSSSYNLGHTISGLRMYSIPVGSTAAAVVGTSLDLTNSGIVNIAEFNKWHPASSAARVTFFQYNPFKKRLYVVTDEIGLIHIFQISGTDWNTTSAAANDLSAFWAAATRYPSLSYVKSIALSGDGAAWGSPLRCNMTIEVDQSSGDEAAIVFTRDASANYTGSVTRVPWIEN
jgi:hypothetical protein